MRHQPGHCPTHSLAHWVPATGDPNPSDATGAHKRRGPTSSIQRTIASMTLRTKNATTTVLGFCNSKDFPLGGWKSVIQCCSNMFQQKCHLEQMQANFLSRVLQQALIVWYTVNNEDNGTSRSVCSIIPPMYAIESVTTHVCQFIWLPWNTPNPIVAIHWQNKCSGTETQFLVIANSILEACIAICFQTATGENVEAFCIVVGWMPTDGGE